MKLTFWGATRTVTGSKYLISVDDRRVLIDCGLFQGHKELRLRNWSRLPIDPSMLDAVILTHAHIDHSGYLPRLIQQGFKGKIYCTAAPLALCAILLPDSGYLQEEDAYRANRYGYSKHKPAEPLYTKDQGIEAIKHFVPIQYNTLNELFPNFSFKFLPAGHILGAAMVEITHDHHVTIFTGDLGRPHDLIMKPPTTIQHADTLILESTYGNRLHETSNPLADLEKTIQATISKKGSVIIPAFAVGRAQELLYLLYQLKSTHRIPNIPIYLDSPMAENVSDLLIRFANEHRLNPSQCQALCDVATYIKTPEESKAIDKDGVPCIIISASGMLEGGRILHHLKVYLPDSRNTILLTGYQAPGTRGDRLLQGETELKIHGEMIPVHAKVEVMHQLSAHADYQEILDWLSHFKKAPRQTFLTHGELTSSEALQTHIKKQLGWHATIPMFQQTINID